MRQHIWKGVLIDDTQLDARMLSWGDEMAQTLNESLKTEDVIRACQQISDQIAAGAYPAWRDALVEDGYNAPDEVILSLQSFLNRASLEKKLKSELGTTTPFEIRRVQYDEQHYETWSPMGVLVHITAGNSPIVAPMACVEGLLSGNINILKVAHNLGQFATLFLLELSGYYNLGSFIYMLRISSSEKERLQKVIDNADCVSAWGGEEAIKAIRSMTPQSIPVVAWGHKISFAYISEAALTAETMDQLAKGICRNEQESCSSPQCVMIDTHDTAVVHRAGQLLAEALERARHLYPIRYPNAQQAAEITTVTQLYRNQLCYSQGQVYEPADHLFRVLVSDTTYFMPSPLFRTIWLSPLPNDRIVGSLRQMRQYLQTAGLACQKEELYPIVTNLYRAGVARITPIGSMSASYTGEPHDGVLALSRFVKRVSFRTEIPMSGICSFAELAPYQPAPAPQGRIQGKPDYPPVPEEGTRIVMKSGGTTGDPVFCPYSENDYRNYIVDASVKAFMACGLDPKKDVVADLLKAGNLYGGMNCFISVFDKMQSPHLNVSGLDDYQLAAHYIMKGRATALLGAPSYIVRLLKENEAAFKAYGRINKILYGGEPLTNGQMQYIQETFGVTQFISFLYGANETGTMGYPCACCVPGEFHLNSEIQQLEILKIEEDAPVEGEEVGRLIFTGYKRENGHTERYEIGDLGQWISGPCACGRTEPRFRLLGRYGNVIRLGGTFFNYMRICNILSSAIGYSGRLQLLVNLDKQALTFCMEEVSLTQEQLVHLLLDSGYDSFAKTIPTKLITVSLRILKPDEFIMNTTSIKLKPIIYVNE